MTLNKYGRQIIEVIDQRIDSYIKESKITVRYIGQIKEVLGNNRYRVQLVGYDTIYTFPARPYVDSIVNDYVYIESKAGNIDNGIIIDKLNGSYGTEDIILGHNEVATISAENIYIGGS